MQNKLNYNEQSYFWQAKHLQVSREMRTFVSQKKHLLYYHKQKEQNHVIEI